MHRLKTHLDLVGRRLDDDVVWCDEQNAGRCCHRVSPTSSNPVAPARGEATRGFDDQGFCWLD
jgi:hypothetical protein